MRGWMALRPAATIWTALAVFGAAVMTAGELARPGSDEIRASLERGAYAEAEQASRAALCALDASGRADSLEAADNLDLLVAALGRLAKERTAEARALAEKAVAIRTRLQGTDHPDTATSMLGLATVLRRQRDFAGAQPLHERALAIRERAFGPESAEYGDALNALANLLYDAGNPAMAMPLYQRVLAIRERVLGPDHPDTADALNNLGSTQRRLGDATAARLAYERALSIFEHAFGPEHLKVANTLNNLAITLKNSGEWAQARRCWERALPIYQREFGGDHPFVAGLLNNLADLALKVGDLPEARRLLERSLAIRERTLGPDHVDVAQSLNNLAAVFKEQGDLLKARPLLERSVAMREKALGEAHPDLAYSLNNLGELLNGLGDLPGARATHERAREIREHAFGPNHPNVAESLHNLALVRLAQGDAAAARPLAERALELWVRVNGEIHPRSAQASTTLARVLLVVGDLPGSLDAALRAEDWARAHLQLTASRLSEREALSYAGVRASGRDLALSVLAAGGSTADQRRRVWESVARARGVVLESLLQRRLAGGESTDPALARLTAARDRAGEEYARQVVAGSAGNTDEGARQQLDAARNAMEKAERELAARSAPFDHSMARRELTVDQVSAFLPPGSALVSFVRFARETLSPATHAPGPPVEHYLALILRAGEDDVKMVPLGAAARLETLVESWGSEASHGLLAPGRTPAGAIAAYRQAGRALRRAAWDPLQAHLAETRLVLIVPDGVLHRVSWMTLPVGRSAYLVERGPTIHLLTAEREVVLLAGHEHHGVGLLAVGAPDYDAMPERASPLGGLPVTTGSAPPPEVPPSLRFAPLPETAREVDEVAAIWRESPGVHTPDPPADRGEGETVEDVVLLRGAEASESAVTSASAGRLVVHIATHALFLGTPGPAKDPTLRGLGGLAPTGSTAALAVMEGRVGISGLALAGANRRGSSRGESDGVLTTDEIGFLDLSTVEWAVLSACETGTGRLHVSEGVLGLQRAFRQAGARSVIVSLWAVDDRATRAWMATLYRARLDDGLATAEAVRRAALHLLAERRTASSSHPFAWGAFVATGDWR
ncbi:MAG: tetratricopeptide repeat protein [Acidobacteriota bacterium]